MTFALLQPEIRTIIVPEETLQQLIPPINIQPERIRGSSRESIKIRSSKIITLHVELHHRMMTHLTTTELIRKTDGARSCAKYITEIRIRGLQRSMQIMRHNRNTGHLAASQQSIFPHFAARIHIRIVNTQLTVKQISRRNGNGLSGKNSRIQLKEAGGAVEDEYHAFDDGRFVGVNRSTNCTRHGFSKVDGH